MEKELTIKVDGENIRKKLYETIANLYKDGYEFQNKGCYDGFCGNIVNKTKSNFKILTYDFVEYEDKLFENNIFIITFGIGEYVDTAKITLIRKNEEFDLPSFKSGEQNNDKTN